MKTLIALMVCWYCAVGLYAQAPKSNAWAQEPVNKKAMYCAALLDGKMVMRFDGKVLTADVTLPNGTKITTDGTIITLRNGECVDKNGNPEKLTQIEKEK